MIKGVLITENDIKVVEVDGNDFLHNIYKLLDVELIDIACRSIDGEYFDFIVDDEGLLKDNYISVVRDGNVDLVGNTFICKHDGNGNEASLTDAECEKILNRKHWVEYMSIAGDRMANACILVD